jgi:hypothetical protein
MPRQKNETLIRSRQEMGLRLRWLRETVCGKRGCGIAFEPLLSAINVPRRSWGFYESGTALTPEIMLRLIIELHVSPEWLRSGDGTMFVDGTPPRAFQ